jgi:Na+/proline symporter
MMIARFLPPAMLGLGLAAVWAAIMSTLDAMMLTLSTMLTRDLLGRFFPGYVREKGREVIFGRIFIVLIALLALAGAVIRPGTIYDIAKFAFTGYSLTVPAMLAGLDARHGLGNISVSRHTQSALALLLLHAVSLVEYVWLSPSCAVAGVLSGALSVCIALDAPAL